MPTTITDVTRSLLAGGLLGLLGTLSTIWFSTRRSKVDVEIAMAHLEMDTEKERVEQARKDREEERASRKEHFDFMQAMTDRLEHENDRLRTENEKLKSRIEELLEEKDELVKHPQKDGEYYP